MLNQVRGRYFQNLRFCLYDNGPLIDYGLFVAVFEIVLLFLFVKKKICLIISIYEEKHKYHSIRTLLIIA